MLLEIKMGARQNELDNHLCGDVANLVMGYLDTKPIVRWVFLKLNDDEIYGYFEVLKFVFDPEGFLIKVVRYNVTLQKGRGGDNCWRRGVNHFLDSSLVKPLKFKDFIRGWGQANKNKLITYKKTVFYQLVELEEFIHSLSIKKSIECSHSDCPACFAGWSIFYILDGRRVQGTFGYCPCSRQLPVLSKHKPPVCDIITFRLNKLIRQMYPEFVLGPNVKSEQSVTQSYNIPV